MSAIPLPAMMARAAVTSVWTAAGEVDSMKTETRPSKAPDVRIIYREHIISK